MREDESEDRFGYQNYWLAFFGEPSAADVWGWQFGGHHLAVNVTVAHGRSYLSSSFVGVEQPFFSAGETVVAPFDAYLQTGLVFIDALDDDQWTAATLPDRPGIRIARLRIPRTQTGTTRV